MTNESLWLINAFNATGNSKLLVKSFYKTQSGKRIWFEEDLKNEAKGQNVHTYAFLKLCNHDADVPYDGWYFWKCNDKLNDRNLFEFEYPFKDVDTRIVPIDFLKKENLDRFTVSLFAQMMIASSKGYDIRLGPYGSSITKSSSINTALVECDMMVDES